MKRVTVEIELTEDTATKLDELIQSRCLDRERWLEKVLLDGIQDALEKRAMALDRISRAKN